jgi:hypothetical protein
MTTIAEEILFCATTIIANSKTAAAKELLQHRSTTLQGLPYLNRLRIWFRATNSNEHHTGSVRHASYSTGFHDSSRKL